MRHCPFWQAVLCFSAVGYAVAAPDPTQPFTPDDHTLLLYHFDEGQGAVAKDSSRYGYDGEVRGATWAKGKFGSALLFDGENDSVFRETTEAIRGLEQITVECWFKQRRPEGRQFLVGKDVTFHFDLANGASTSVSLYNQGGRVKNAQGLRHKQLAASLGSARYGRWHHNAVTYDGRHVSFFFDGVLKRRVPAPKDFSLGVKSRGLWVGCYIGQDFWYSGVIDEVRVSDCVRYDPEKKLRPGQRIFDMPRAELAQRAVRKPKTTGKAMLQLNIRWLYGGSADGWVSLKAPRRPAVIVGRYDLHEAEQPFDAKLEFDVSDEFAGGGCYVVGLESDKGRGYIAVTQARLAAGGSAAATWTGEAKSRRTFKPPVLVPLRLGPPAAAKAGRIVLLPDQADRVWGELEIDRDDPDEPVVAFGEGLIEYWVDVPAASAYRVYMRYAAPAMRPCDFVIDGRDLNDYDMCAVDRTDGGGAAEALWEYQGTTKLDAGVHWLRLQDVLPEIVAVRLEPVATAERPATPRTRYFAPDGAFLAKADSWQAQTLLGAPRDAAMKLDPSGALRFAAVFTNTNKSELFAGDAVRLAHRGQWNLEPFGRLTFGFEGQGSGHVISLWAIDVKGDEKLLWRQRDSKAGTQAVTASVSFEGNDVFDPAHVAALCFDLDEGNVKADQVNRFAGAIVNPVFERRDALVEPEGRAAAVAQAKQALADLPIVRGARLRARGFNPWTKPVVPEEHPLYTTTTPKPVTRKTLGYTLHMTGARSIRADTLDRYHKFYNFGDVCWPHIGNCPQRSRYKEDAAFANALEEFERQLVDVRDRGLYLFDIWGYVPYNTRFPFRIEPEVHAVLMRVLGDRFLGYDNGEQDGRYIGSYARKGKHTNRKEGWDDFVRWDEHICNDSMNYMDATGSLNFSHYYAERGCRMLGLETAQGLPSDTLMFAFLRGAGKQYGRLIYQAASVWNRFGYNMYHARKTTGHKGYGYGPNKGCSLSLHKRLFFCGYLGGHSIFGTETAQFTADSLPNRAGELSALGRQHVELRDWVDAHPDRGVMYTPVAFMLDFYNGWNMPRHLYRRDKYMIWGKFPYEKGDYLIDAVFRMVWPGYEDCSYLRNERGFVCPTPFGDSFDVITNRCHPDVLKQYGCVMLLSDVEMTPQVVNALTDYVEQGGDLVLSAANAKALPPALAGVKMGAQGSGCTSRLTATGGAFEEQPYTYAVLTPTSAQVVLDNELGHALMTVNAAGRGRVAVCAVDYWMTDKLTYRAPEIVNMEPPYELLAGVQAVLADYFDSFNPVTVEPGGLTIRTCCYDGEPKRLLVGLMNNDLFADWSGALRVRVGEVVSAKDLWRDRAQLVNGRIELALPAGDVAVVDVRLK